ncbi:MAG: 2OG-Fe(II) oxygenase family protein [Pseudomonadota bacterium]
MTNNLREVEFEKTLGGEGIETDDRIVPIIDVSDFELRRDEISEALWKAATEVGFFQLKKHSLQLDLVRSAFAASEAFFKLDNDEKSDFSLKSGLNAGWEFMSQVRPSTGTADQKESFQITLPHMNELWPTQTQVPEFQRILLEFEYKAWLLGMKILSCFADKLGFERDFFTQGHNRSSQHYQSTLRLLHYLPLAREQTIEKGIWRAGAHTDFDCLTMVFQRNGQSGLQVCPGRGAEDIQVWSSVEPNDELITCNIGDMLMRWSDDKLKSTLHRVKMPNQDEYRGSRYSMAFFCQANKDAIIQGPEKKYPAITAKDYILQRINANFAR